MYFPGMEVGDHFFLQPMKFLTILNSTSSFYNILRGQKKFSREKLNDPSFWHAWEGNS